jgi:hypothetical protein
MKAPQPTRRNPYETFKLREKTRTRKKQGAHKEQEQPRAEPDFSVSNLEHRSAASRKTDKEKRQADPQRKPQQKQPNKARKSKGAEQKNEKRNKGRKGGDETSLKFTKRMQFHQAPRGKDPKTDFLTQSRWPFNRTTNTRMTMNPLHQGTSTAKLNGRHV